MHPSTIARRRVLHQNYLDKHDKELFEAAQNTDNPILRHAALIRWQEWRVKHGLSAPPREFPE